MDEKRMVQYLVALAPTLLVIAFFLFFPFNWPRKRTWTRAVTCAVVFAIALRYLYWRFTESVLPYPNDGVNFYWVWFLFAVELLAFADILLFLTAMSRYVDRSAEADRLEPGFFKRDPSFLPTVDVFIPTYNEPLDVLERTIVGALALDYPREKLRVYVLDDKRRDWLRDYCEEKGAIHVTRPDNSHAKAGNMNNGLAVSSGDFIAIFDADFVPYRSFLRRTLPFFVEASVGIVQTPQHFFNKDPVQTNLGLEEIWPDEQRLFFDEMAASRDAWDVSFCCGSCSIARREAVIAIGGFPTESITEDLLTTLTMLNKGYKTRYLNERLSMGLAAENLKGYFVQRERWCQGGIQTLFLHNGPLRGPGLSLFQRLMFLPLSWLVQYVVRFAILIVPAVYLWTGLEPMFFTNISELIWFQFPLLAAYFLLMAWMTPTRYLPVVSSAVGAFSTFRMLPTVISSVIRPFGKPFQVTPKGSGNEQSEFDAYTFTCIAGLIAVTAAGLLINIVPESAQVRGGQFSVVAACWAGVNILTLLVAALICFEKPRKLLTSFRCDEVASLDGCEGRVVSLALDKSVVAVPIGTRFVSPAITLKIEGVGEIKSEINKITRRRERRGRSDDKLQHFLHLSYSLEGAIRDEMIVKLYTGNYSQDVAEMDKSAISFGLIARAFGPDMAARA
jgi:cellulose synthase (UDP-forming)